MKIPDEIIEQVRDATDIIEVVSQYVTLKKRGKTFLGLCPFHQEKTPSFSVDPVRGFYHCFGCGVGGNVFSFVMEMEKVSFPEAVRSLAEKSNIDVPLVQQDPERSKEIEQLYYANGLAADFFEKCLYETQAGKKAKSYLIDRAFPEELIKKFRIGYAPNRWDGLMQMAARQKFSNEGLAKAGLVVPKKNEQGFYDRFRGRLMIPIMNPSGRVVAFGGRILKEDKQSPKYLNSPETLVYHKTYILFGLSLAKSAIQHHDQVFLVEGYTDVMRLHQFGFENCVATSGTALTSEQAKLLLRFTKNVVLVYDGDSAGLAAAIRGIDVLVEQGLSVQVVALPGGEDPDSYLRKQGEDGFSDQITKAKNLVDFHVQYRQSTGKLKNARQKADMVNELLASLAKIKDPVERNIMIHEMAEKVGVTESVLMQQIQKHKSSREETTHFQKKEAPNVLDAELGLLYYLIHEETSNHLPLIFEQIGPAQFHQEEERKLFEIVFSKFQKGQRISSNEILSQYSDDPDLIHFITRLISEPSLESTDLNSLGLDCLLEIVEDKWYHQIRLKIKQLKETGKETIQASQELIDLKKKWPTIQQDIVDEWKKDVEI